MREKLIELIREIDKNVIVSADMTWDEKKESMYFQMANYLIANGVMMKSNCEDCASKTTRIIDKLHGENAKLREIQRWIPVTERLPEKGEEVLVFGYWHEKFQPLMCYLSPHRKGEWFTTVAGQQVYTVTHWMPLPEAPKGE